MREIERESLASKYLIFFIALLIGGILWSVLISFSAVSLEKAYGKGLVFHHGDDSHRGHRHLHSRLVILDYCQKAGDKSDPVH